MFVLGIDMPYRDTMVLAMNNARDEEGDNSLLDLERSIHTKPLCALNADVSEELNASRQFEQFLNAELDVDSSPSKVSSGLKRLSDNEQYDDSLIDMIRKEAEESKAFEEFLSQSLLEEA